MQLERHRDNQQWILDYLVKVTGRVQNFFDDGRTVPPEVKSYAMIPRALGKEAAHREALAQAAEAAGHIRTARQAYWLAADTYREAQHAIFQDDHPLKIHFWNKVDACYDKVIEYSDYPIERVEIPWEGRSLAALVHLLPDRRKAPFILYIPGMDGTKENALNPLDNVFLQHGFHVLCLDGPGQGSSNLRKIRVTADNYERAGRAAVDYILTRPELEGDRIALVGSSMGCYWGSRIAGSDPRIKACATARACYGPKVHIFNQASPRFKQVFMYMAGIHDEAAFDRLAEQMTLDGWGPRIQCPALLVTGEYDPLSYLEETEAFFEEIAGPKELWIFENEAHSLQSPKALGGVHLYHFMLDWVRDALDGRFGPGYRRRVYITTRAHGPYTTEAPDELRPAALPLEG
jgi:pimeloyl-ACP methyl ester carboxylesterase